MLKLSLAPGEALATAPSQSAAAAALSGFGFSDPLAAAGGLHELAREHIPFLSTRRCRHFLSLIADRLLQEVGATPDPDRTLVDLVRVSNSLGGKGVLWELFSFHPASLQLYVRLCAASPYLSGILTTNPGMIDDLVDSLQLDRLPTRAELDRTLAELSRGADDVLPILHDLKNSAHLRIGVRDILGKEEIDATHAALADVAEFCLSQVVERDRAVRVQDERLPDGRGRRRELEREVRGGRRGAGRRRDGDQRDHRRPQCLVHASEAMSAH